MNDRVFSDDGDVAIGFLLQDIRRDMEDYPLLINRVFTLSEGYDDMDDRCYFIYINTVRYNYFIHFYPDVAGYASFFAVSPISTATAMEAYHCNAMTLIQYNDLHTCLEDYFGKPLL